MEQRKIHTVRTVHTVHTARSAAYEGHPFRANGTFYGRTAKGNVSDKFWRITGRGTGPVTVTWGRWGSQGRSQVIPFEEAMDRFAKKTRKYSF